MHESVLASAARARANALAKGTDPGLGVLGLQEVVLVVGFETERTELTFALVDLRLVHGELLLALFVHQPGNQMLRGALVADVD